jgi:metallophosphoesterase
MTYFTSDLHFGHANIMKFHPNFRKFQNINDMDNTLIRLWNSRVNPCDEVYNLGDVSFHKDFEQTLKILKRLNGKHVLILGNHDQEIRKRADELLEIRKNDNNALFEEICDYKELALNVGYGLHGKILEFGEILDFVKDLPPYSHGGNQFGENEDEGVRAQKIKGFLRLINK